ncbi:glycoside hydrolase family 72 protein [Lentithecium fluviatile CBS 122367]|uniref:1,3-beta-glucanosyltransferase n=1 Tax=Lentithecium fluviatile CBS 122367 TaxID=1168545 RepID=A0A6G1JJT7_9PLEO|nr:glycoside hydrolase family 72 protein [Lentithecium fluviatile CBS 122367]
MRSAFHSLTALVAIFTSVAHAVHPVSIQGQDFIDTVTKKRFQIVGVDYQPGGQGGYVPQSGKDPLTDKEVCLRDAIMLQRLGVNTIRVYNVDPTFDHNDCASIFNAAGIYMIIDVNGPFSGESINRAEPWTSYHEGYLTRIFGVVENFKAYPNTLAFFAANEVMNDQSTAKINPQYIRAVQRDLKNYIKNNCDRTIPVGYSAADVREILEDTWAYMQCDHSDDQSSSDFFGLNSYSWCGGDATFESAGYNTLVDMFKDSAIPVFFSEYGCNEVKPRVFDEVAALYSDKMTSISGGLVYEYSQEDSDYGLAIINENGTVTLRTDYDNLQKQFNALDIAAITGANPSGTSNKAPACDADLITSGIFDTNFTIPAVCPNCADLIKNGIDNPRNGKLVTVNDTKAPKAVYGSSGVEVQGLELRLLSNDAANTPTNETTSPTGTSTGTGASTTESKKGAASKTTSGYALFAAVLFTLLTVL